MKKLLSFMLSLAVISGTFTTITALAEDAVAETFGNNTVRVSQDGKCIGLYNAELGISLECCDGIMQIDGNIIQSDDYLLDDEECERLEKLTGTADIAPIEYIEFSDNVTEINCKFVTGFYKELKLIDFGKNLEKIGEYAFEYSKTDRVYFPDSLREIGEGAFEDCDNIYTAAIPENVGTIGDYAFMDCDSLDNVAVFSRNAVFGDKCIGYLYTDEKKADITIRGYAGSTAEAYALENGFDFIELPEDSSYEAEFSDDMKNVRIYDIVSDTEYTLSDGVLTVDGKILDLGQRVHHNDSFFTEKDKETALTFIFMIEDEATEIVYTDNVTEIYSDLSEIYSENLKKITFGRNVSEISSDMFDYVPYQTEIHGCSGTDAEKTAMRNYLNFVDIDTDNAVYYGDMRDTADYKISEDKKTLSWEYPDYVNNHKHRIKDGVYTIDGTVIENEKDFSIDELKDEELEKLKSDVKTVHEWTENNPVEEVVFSDNVKEIYAYNRNNFADSAKKVTFGENVEIIGECVFDSHNGSQITEIVFGNKLKKIGRSAFSGLNMLTEITIPESVEEIGMDAFFACDSLSDVTVLSRNAVFGFECLGYTYSFPDGESTDITIHGYKGSTAEAYALENGFDFIVLDESVTLCGDANLDGLVTIADATAIVQAIGNPDEYALSEQGERNADCFNTGDGVTGKDALAIQLLESELIDSLPLNDIVPEI